MAGSRDTHWYDAAVARITEDDGEAVAERVHARLEGYDVDDLKWRRIGVDDDGNLLIAGGAVLVTGLSTSAMYSGTTSLTPKFARIVASSSGATEVVAAVTLKKIRVLSYVVVADAAVNVKFQSHVTPTDKTGLMYCAAKGGVSSGFSPVGHFETVAGEALDINLSGAVAVGGHVSYLEI